MKKVLFVLFLGTIIMLSSCSKCENSITTIQLPIADDPIVTIRLVFHTGSMDDPAGKNGLAVLTARLMTEGSTTKNKYQDILKKLFPMASNYNVRVDREYTTFIGRTHNDNLDAFYTLFKEALLEPAFLEEDFNRLKAESLNYLKTNLRYSNDEELGKAVFKAFVYRGTPYEKNVAGTVSDLETITLADVKDFYKKNFTQKRLIVGVAGNYKSCLPDDIAADFAALPVGEDETRPAVVPQKINGLEVKIVEKRADSTGIHIGFPIDLMRSDKDFHALFLANSWLGEHRNSSSHLYQVIREDRGMNYGDYSYIEDFPQGGMRQFPPTNIYKKPQLFEIWIRPVQNAKRLFALRAALRELKKLVDEGMSKEDFELTKKFLSKYYLHFASTSSVRLGYKIDDHIYGMKEGYLENFRKHIDALTLEQVNAAIKKHLQYDNLKIVFVTADAEALKKELEGNLASPIDYATPKPAAVMEEDKIIENFPVKVAADHIDVVPVDDVFK